MIGRTLVVAALAAGLGTVWAGGTVHAATFTVTSDADSGAGTLRDAIAQANAAVGPDVITFDPSVTTITLATEIEITDDLRIEGSGVTLDGASVTRIFVAFPSDGVDLITVTIAGGTLTNAVPTDDGPNGPDGGALYAESTTLNLESVTFTGNQAPGPPPDGAGGAVALFGGDLTITGSTFTGNSAASFGGALDVSAFEVMDGGGDTLATGSILITDSSFSENVAGDGGGAMATGCVAGTTQILRTQFVGNSAEVDGGAITLGCHSAPVTLDAVTVTGNTASVGGGVAVGLLGLQQGPEPVQEQELIVRNSAISGNSAVGGQGDGVGGGVGFDLLVLDPATRTRPLASFTDTTIAGNTSDGVGGGIGAIVVPLAEGDNAGPLFGALRLDRVTVSGNSAGFSGGGLQLLTVPFGGAGFAGAELINSTISGNSALQGAGIDVSETLAPHAAGSYSLVAKHSTITLNSATDGGGGINFVPAEADESDATALIDHTIVAGNAAATGPDVNGGTGSTASFSLIGDPLGSALTLGAGVQTGVAPLLGPLGDNGGLTATHLPIAGSPAINAGDAAITGAPDTDQRGLARIIGLMDVGAVEVNPGVISVAPTTMSIAEGATATLTVTRTGGSEGDASVTIGSADGTATAAAEATGAAGAAPLAVAAGDYSVLSPTTLSWTAGDTSPRSVTVSAVSDDIVEGDESFTVQLSAAFGAALGDAVVSVTIIDATPPPTTTTTTTTTTPAPPSTQEVTPPSPDTLPATGQRDATGMTIAALAALGVGLVLAGVSRRRRT